MLNLQHHVMEEPKSSTGRDLQCPLPPSSFHHERDLDVHSHLRAKVHTRSQWSCATCDGSVLSRHVMAVHQKLTPFKCSFPSCSYPTAQRGNLRCHQRLHSTDPMTRRPFPCNFPGCDYRATLKFNLTAHIQSRHRGNRARTFGCSSCPAKFYYARHLRSYINAIHVKEKMYSCNKCPYKSSRKYNLVKNLKTVYCDGGRADEPEHESPAPESSGHETNEVVSKDGAELEQIPSAA